MAFEVMSNGHIPPPSDRVIYNNQGEILNLDAYCTARIDGFAIGDVICGRLFVERYVSDFEYRSLPPDIRSPYVQVSKYYDEDTDSFCNTSEAAMTERAIRNAYRQAADGAARNGILVDVPGQTQYPSSSRATADQDLPLFNRENLRSRFERRPSSDQNPPLFNRENLRSRFERRPPLGREPRRSGFGR
jgi:hypothetical protein